MIFCQRRPLSVQLSMEENMCQQTKSLSKPSPTNYLYQQSPQRTATCHQCNMCSSYSSSPSSSTSGSSSSSSSSLSATSASVMSSSNESHGSKRSFERKNSNGCFIQQHLQSMFGLLRREETLKMAVRLESSHPSRTRYLVVVSRIGKNQSDECCLLGIDCNQRSTVGLVLKVLADTAITLDGDGGFSVSVCGRQHIFKPVSVQAMWSALQTLYKISNKARDYNYFEGGNTHEWVDYYEQHIQSDRSCLNEWHTMNDIESRRPPSPDSLRSKPRERLETERTIRSKLKEIMMSVDLDEVTSKYIRSRLEELLDMDLREFKSFIDQEMLVILGQLDEATEVFSHVYLGSEWNASNLEELNKHGICHILNVTREIDNFFPGTFDYMNVRVYDDDNTDLLKHWDNTYKYIDKVKNKNSKVLVHCKMGISRSASVVIAYAMKAYGWDFKKAFEYVQKKRSCIKPNQNFLNQLETYQGMLDAMKNREKLQRSKSETNLKSGVSNTHFHAYHKMKREEHNDCTDAQVKENEENSDDLESEYPMLRVCSGVELAQLSMRPKSWSPDNLMTSEIFNSTGTMSQSLEHLNICKLDNDSHSSSASSLSASPPRIPPAPPLPPADSRYNLNVGIHCENGLTYSVSQNKIVQLYCAQSQKNSDAKLNESETRTIGKKPETPPESNNFALQLPSKFQSSTVMFSKQENANNLVIKGISDIAVDDARKVDSSVSESSQKFFNKELDLLRKHKNLLTDESDRDLATHCVDNNVRYQNHAQKQNEMKKRTPFDLIESTQKTEFISNNVYNDAGVRVMAESTNRASMFNSVSKVVSSDTTTTASCTTMQYSSVKHRTTMLERLNTSHSQRANLYGEKEDETKSGKVSTLTKEFEAKLKVLDKGKQRKKKSPHQNYDNEDTRSLPCSPVSEPTLIKKGSSSAPSSTTFTEDLSVRDLVVKYEFAKCNKDRTKNEKKHPPIPPRKSSLDINLPRPKGLPKSMYPRNHRGVTPALKTFLNPSNELRNTVAKANPLSKLTFCKQRNNNAPVFNTM